MFVQEQRLTPKPTPKLMPKPKPTWASGPGQRALEQATMGAWVQVKTCNRNRCHFHR